jgi:hypothetical protein
MPSPEQIQLDSLFAPSTPAGLVQRLETHLREGRMLIPLVGAGCSVPSGIPTVEELRKYLAMCVGLALGIDRDKEAISERWHPRTNMWPPMRGDWLRNAKLAEEMIRHNVRGSTASGISQNVYREAFGDLGDWRLALLFLSRLKAPEAGSEKPEIELVGSDPHVFDSFFHHITRNKTPCMAHRMLAHFADALRARITLTLNFDDLLEQSFQDAGIHANVFEVHQAASLPPYSLLGRAHAIVKIHGGKYGLRANLSLDEVPNEQERKHFRSYFLGRDWTETDDELCRFQGHLPAARGNLLVVGVSGRDRRVLLLIKDAIEHLSGLDVFWICRSPSAAAELAESCRRVLKNRSPAVKFVQHIHLGTLLWQVYQRLMNCVPPGGIEFPVSWQIPLVPEYSRDSLKRSQFDRAKDWLQDNDNTKILVLRSPRNPSVEWGVSSVSWELFQHAISRHNAIWIDGEDVAGHEDLKERLFHAVCVQLGQVHQLPPMQHLSDREYLDDLKVRMSQSGRPWILFINLRGYLGYSANMFARLEREPQNWSRTSELKRVAELLRIIGSESLAFLRIVVLCREGQSALSDGNMMHVIRFSSGKQAHRNRSWARHRVEAARNWANRGENRGEESPHFRFRWRLLRALAVFPLVRHHTALVARSIARLEFEEKWSQNWEDVNLALRDLVEMKLVRQKPGGFLWMHWQVREELSKLFKKGSRIQPTNEDDRLDIHIGLADWSMTLFHATRDPLAACQAIFHRCRVAQFALARAKREPKGARADLVRVRSSLCEALNHFESARASILAWGSRLDADRALKGVFVLLKAVANASGPGTRGGWRNRRFLSMAGAKLLLYRIWLHRDLGDCSKVLKLCSELNAFLNNPFHLGRSAAKEHRHNWSVEHYRLRIQCELEEAVVCISLRNYTGAVLRLCSLATDAGIKISTILDAGRDKEVEQAITKWADEQGIRTKDPHRYERRRLMIFVFRRLMETALLQHEARTLLELCGKTVLESSSQHLTQAQRFYIAARMLPRFVTEDEFSNVRIERSRLHSVMAGVLVCRGDYSGVQRQINEAWNAAFHLPESEEFIARCVVDLRRAYCELHKLVRIPEVGDFAGRLMADWTYAIPQLPTPGCRILAQVTALLEDTRLNLSRIETRMNRNRKTLWWWMTLRRYQMVVMQYTEMTRLWRRSDRSLCDAEESAGSLDRLTLEDCQAAQILLFETAKRVSEDAFQLARIAHNGCNMARLALMKVAGERRPKAETWERCALEWRRCLSYLQKRLRALRAEYDPPRTQSHRADDAIRIYVDHVDSQLRHFLDSHQ